MMDIKVRKADVGDVVELARMGQGAADLSGKYIGLNFIPSDFVKYCVYLLTTDSIITLMAEVDGKIAGAISGQVSPWRGDFTQLLLQEIAWWVDDECRGSGVGKALVEEFSRIGKEHGATHLTIGAVPTKNGEGLIEYYRKKGYTEIGVHFIKEL
jgi:GNAT superfamily N-acetyltransferase